jgi:hypothetical protein
MKKLLFVLLSGAVLSGSVYAQSYTPNTYQYEHRTGKQLIMSRELGVSEEQLAFCAERTSSRWQDTQGMDRQRREEEHQRREEERLGWERWKDSYDRRANGGYSGYSSVSPEEDRMNLERYEDWKRREENRHDYRDNRDSRDHRDHQQWQGRVSMITCLREDNPNLTTTRLNSVIRRYGYPQPLAR